MRRNKRKRKNKKTRGNNKKSSDLITNLKKIIQRMEAGKGR